MIINLKDIPIYWINLEKDKEKREFQETQFLEYGLDKNYRIDGVEFIRKAYLSQLITLYKIRKKLPALILEDDVVVIKEHFKYNIEVPDDIDALYLGHSIWGLPKEGETYPACYDEPPYVRPGVSTQKSLGATVHTNYNDTLVRTHNMLSTHAILYVSEDYVNYFISKLEKYIFKTHIDVVAAAIQNDFKVLTPKDPYFYQKDFHNVDGYNIEYYTLNPKVNNGKINIKDKF